MQLHYAASVMYRHHTLGMQAVVADLRIGVMVWCQVVQSANAVNPALLLCGDRHFIGVSQCKPICVKLGAPKTSE